jgi:alkylation response protein AidB-like acyl-CoA dehydrogenase
MDLSYPPEAEEVRHRFRDFLAANLPKDCAGTGSLPESERLDFLSRWRAQMASGGWLGLSWPREYGGSGLSLVEQAVVTEEIIGAGLPYYAVPNDPFGLGLLGPTLMRWGTDAQKNYFLPRTLDGSIRWSQGYSEPDAGSDLFSLRTSGRVDLEREELIVDGQKTWTTAAITANWLFALVRTDPKAERGRGLSFVLIPIEQAGVEVRGVRTMAGSTDLAEIFFTAAVAPLDNVVGGLGNGAHVALTLLGFERGATALAAALGHQAELLRLVQLIEAKGQAGSSDVRVRLARCQAKVHALRCLAWRGLLDAVHGEELGPRSSVAKLFAAEYHQEVTQLAMDVLGPDVLALMGSHVLDVLRPQPKDLDALMSRPWIEDFLNSRARTIYGGTSEIQRNTIAEQILGMPRQPRPNVATELAR